MRFIMHTKLFWTTTLGKTPIKLHFSEIPGTTTHHKPWSTKGFQPHSGVGREERLREDAKDQGRARDLLGTLKKPGLPLETTPPRISFTAYE